MVMASFAGLQSACPEQPVALPASTWDQHSIQGLAVSQILPLLELALAPLGSRRALETVYVAETGWRP